MENKIIKKQLNMEINKLINSKWYFYHSSWNSITKKYNHRTTLKNIPDIGFIKDVLFNKLGNKYYLY